MKEVKYISHISRNLYLYFILYFTLRLLNIISLKPEQLIIGLTAFVLSYTPIYFLNDYADVSEDKKLNKANLFLLINNKNLYWTIHFLLIISGFLLSFYINPLSVVILITLYLVNLIYSFPPLRLRNINFFRELLIFIIYFLKWLLIITYWNLSYGNLPVHILIMASS